MKFTDDEMWKATVDCDSRYDCKFFYAVKTVGVYCRPDLLAYAPALDIARKTKALIDDCFHRRDRPAAQLKQLGVSASHLSVIFKQQYGMRPIQYVNQLRIAQAKELLAQTDMPVIDVAAEIGYDSLSAFHSFFKRHTKTTPGEFRRRKLHG